jgi:hypothetical protein
MPLSLGSLTDYNISEIETTVAEVKWVGAAAFVFCLINGRAFLMTDIGGGIYQVTLYGGDIRQCVAAAVNFSAGTATGPTGDALTIAGSLTVTAVAGYDIALIEAQIVTILSSIPELKTVLDYEPKIEPELPAVTLFYKGFAQAQTEAVSFTITHKWNMQLYVRLLDAKIAQDELKSLTSKILAKLKLYLSLNGLALLSFTPSATVDAILGKNNPILVVSFEFTAMKEED